MINFAVYSRETGEILRHGVVPCQSFDLQSLNSGEEVMVTTYTGIGRVCLETFEIIQLESSEAYPIDAEYTPMDK